MKNIFVTGATGFLGWELVKNLLKDKDSRLYLLVRSNSKGRANERVRRLINKTYKGAGRGDVRNRICVLEGDITERNLGIPESGLEKLSKEINSIYHCAALCEFGVPLEPIRKINVSGTKNVLDFGMRCRENGQFKSFHHVSTLAVMGDSGGMFYENDLDVGQKFNNTYEQTKFEAEKLIDKYREKGLLISIYRPSVITGHSISGEVSDFQFFYHPLHIFSLGIFEEVPVNRKIRCNLVPVDYVTKALYLISSNAQNNNKNYHLANPNTITLDSLLDIASFYFGFKKPRLVPVEEFDFRTLKGFKKKLIEPYLPYFTHKEVEFDTTNFDRAINGKDFSWPIIDRDLLLRLFKYCADVRFIKVIKRRKRR
jgi:thioester reductase-like protein